MCEFFLSVIDLIPNGSSWEEVLLLAKEIEKEISKHIPNFEMSYNSDFRQKIADSWPCSINDEHAKNDWGWELQYDLKKMTKDMITNLKKEFNVSVS